MDLRASSTTLDTVLFVLLVGASVGVLVGAGPGTVADPTRVTGETADVVATSTANLTVRRRGSIKAAGLFRGEGTETVSVERRVHGTYAELLAAAATANPRLGRGGLTDVGSDLIRQVRNATRRALPHSRANAQIRATWRAYPNASLRDGVVVGERPPPDADVSVATLTVASGFPNVSARLDASTASYSAIARIIARGVVEGLFPPDRASDALASEGPDRAIAAHRYRTASKLLGADIAGALAGGNVTAANRRLAKALTEPVQNDLKKRFDSPAAAARAVTVDEVRIVVRTWSP